MEYGMDSTLGSSVELVDVDKDMKRCGDKPDRGPEIIVIRSESHGHFTGLNHSIQPLAQTRTGPMIRYVGLFNVPTAISRIDFVAVCF